MINVQPLWTPTSAQNDWTMSVDGTDTSVSIVQEEEGERTGSEMLLLRERHETVCFEHLFFFLLFFFGRVLCSGLGKLVTVVCFIGQHFSGDFFQCQLMRWGSLCFVLVLGAGDDLGGVSVTLKNHYIS